MIVWISCADIVNMAHTRQSRPAHGLGFQENVLKTFQFVPSLLDSGLGADLLHEAVEKGDDLDQLPSTPKLWSLETRTSNPSAGP